MDALQLSLPIPASMDEMYIDQAMENSGFVFAAYTPWGIKQIDSDFCRRIQNIERDPKEIRRSILTNYLDEKKRINKDTFILKRDKLGWIRRFRAESLINLAHIGEDPKKLKDEILDNPHLHTGIKQNLIENLDRILTDLGLSTEMSPCR